MSFPSGEICAQLAGFSRRLLRNAVRRYDFEHNLAGNLQGSYNEMLSYLWLCEIEACLSQNRAGASFVEIVNELIQRFADGNPPPEYYSLKRAHFRAAEITGANLSYNHSGKSI
jgi:hypothetical protein